MSGVRALSDVVSEHIQDLKEEDSFYTGFINGKDAFEKFFIHLRASGYWFVTKNSTHTAGDHAKKGAVFFQNIRKGSNLQITFFGALYEHVRNIHYACSQGKKRQHNRKGKMPLTPENQRRIRQVPSKKIGCSASMTVWHISVFPQYTIDKYNVHGSEEQTKLAKQLKADIAAGNEAGAPPSSQPTKYDRFVIRISTANVHNHATLSCAMTQTLHPELTAEIVSLVKKNIFNVEEIKLYLIDFVQKKVEESVWPASEQQNSCFYPSYTIIYNHVYKAIFELREGKLDQDKLEHYVTYCIPSSDEVYFRPYRETRQVGSTTCDGTLFLLCHQTSWQKQLIDRYGSDICVLDTYKKSIYNFPLFFLVVKTNVGYSVAGLFIVQSITLELIADALKVFLRWNPDWDPLYFLTDLSKTEVHAIKKIFPDATVYMCAYYRDQAWDHWLGLQSNDLPPETQTTFKHLWKEIASSRTICEYEENVLIMKNSDKYELYPNVQKYMEKDWLPDASHWVDAFYSEDFLFKLNIKNGVDSQSQLLNHKFIKQNLDKCLSELVHLVLTEYLPIVLDLYKKGQVSTTVESEGKNCPEFLNSRPIHFVRHVMQRYTTASEEYSANDIALIEESRYVVTVGETKNTCYFVDFEIPLCTCSDFARWYFPCTHLCAIFLYVPNQSFEHLPVSYLKSPYLNVDVGFLKFVNSPEIVPMHDNSVTVVEMVQSDVFKSPYLKKPKDLKSPYLKIPKDLKSPYVKKPKDLKSPYLKIPKDLKSPYVKKPKDLKGPYVKKPKNLKSPSLKKPKDLKSTSLKKPKNLKSLSPKKPKDIKSPSLKEPKDLSPYLKKPEDLKSSYLNEDVGCLKFVNSPEIVPMHDTAVTVVEMVQSDVFKSPYVKKPKDLKCPSLEEPMDLKIPYLKKPKDLINPYLKIPEDLKSSYLKKPEGLKSSYLNEGVGFLKFGNSPEIVPMHDTAVTFIEIIRNAVSDSSDTKSIEMTPVKLEIETMDEGSQVRELLKEMYNHTFLVELNENNEECLAKAKSKLLAAKLLLADGIPYSPVDPPPLRKLLKKAENRASRCKRPTEDCAHVSKKIKIPDAQMASGAQTSSITPVVGSRKKCRHTRSSDGSTRVTKTAGIPDLQLDAVASKNLKVVAESPSEFPRLTPSTSTDASEKLHPHEHSKTIKQSIQKPSEMPPLMVRKDEVPNTLRVALARKQSQVDQGHQTKEGNSSMPEDEVTIKEEIV